MFWAAKCQLKSNTILENRRCSVLTLLVIGSRSLTEPQRFMTIADPGTPRGIRSRQRRETESDLSRAHMQLRVVSYCELAQRRLPKFCALLRYRKASTLQVANGQTRGIRVDKVADLPAAVGENRRFILAIHQLAVVDEQSGGYAMTKGLRLEFLEFAQRNGVNVG